MRRLLPFPLIVVLSSNAVIVMSGCTAHKANVAKDTVREMTSCQRLEVMELRDGWRVDGCSASWYCQTPSGPCDSRSCEDWALKSYNQCANWAHDAGPTLGMQILGAITANSKMDECRSDYAARQRDCKARPAQPASAVSFR